MAKIIQLVMRFDQVLGLDARGGLWQLNFHSSYDALHGKESDGPAEWLFVTHSPTTDE